MERIYDFERQERKRNVEGDWNRKGNTSHDGVNEDGDSFLPKTETWVMAQQLEAGV